MCTLKGIYGIILNYTREQKMEFSEKFQEKNSPPVYWACHAHSLCYSKRTFHFYVHAALPTA